MTRRTRLMSHQVCVLLVISFNLLLWTGQTATETVAKNDLYTIPGAVKYNWNILEKTRKVPYFEAVTSYIRDKEVQLPLPTYYEWKLPGWKDDQWFQCLMPFEEPSVESQSPNTDSSRGPLLIEETILSALTGCIYRVRVNPNKIDIDWQWEGWWSYELCHHQHIRQFHSDRDGKVTAEFFLGRRSDTEDSIAEEETFAVPYDKGTSCDLTKTPRRSRVHYRCNTNVNEAVLQEIKEVRTCVYDLYVDTPLLCKHPKYAQQSKENGVRVTCMELPLPTIEEMKEIAIKKQLRVAGLIDAAPPPPPPVSRPPPSASNQKAPASSAAGTPTQQFTLIPIDKFPSLASFTLLSQSSSQRRFPTLLVRLQEITKGMNLIMSRTSLLYLSQINFGISCEKLTKSILLAFIREYRTIALKNRLAELGYKFSEFPNDALEKLLSLDPQGASEFKWLDRARVSLILGVARYEQKAIKRGLPEADDVPLDQESYLKTSINIESEDAKSKFYNSAEGEVTLNKLLALFQVDRADFYPEDQKRIEFYSNFPEFHKEIFKSLLDLAVHLGARISYFAHMKSSSRYLYSLHTALVSHGSSLTSLDPDLVTLLVNTMATVTIETSEDQQLRLSVSFEEDGEEKMQDLVDDLKEYHRLNLLYLSRRGNILNADGEQPYLARSLEPIDEFDEQLEDLTPNYRKISYILLDEERAFQRNHQNGLIDEEELLLREDLEAKVSEFNEQSAILAKSKQKHSQHESVDDPSQEQRPLKEAQSENTDENSEPIKFPIKTVEDKQLDLLINSFLLLFMDEPDQRVRASILEEALKNLKEESGVQDFDESEEVDLTTLDSNKLSRDMNEKIKSLSKEFTEWRRNKKN